MKKILIIMTFAFTAISCNKMYLALNGIKKPRFESIESVNAKLAQYSAGYLRINAIPADSASFVEFLKIMRGLPSNLVFNREGMLMLPEDTGYCAGRAMEFALKLGDAMKDSVTDRIRLQDLSKLVLSTGKDVDLDPTKYDYSMVIFWTNFLGNANLNVFQIMEEMRQRSELKINYVLINMDVQKSWGMKKIPYKF
jgi:hypothetical protein